MALAADALVAPLLRMARANVARSGGVRQDVRTVDADVRRQIGADQPLRSRRGKFFGGAKLFVSRPAVAERGVGGDSAEELQDGGAIRQAASQFAHHRPRMHRDRRQIAGRGQVPPKQPLGRKAKSESARSAARFWRADDFATRFQDRSVAGVRQAQSQFRGRKLVADGRRKPAAEDVQRRPAIKRRSGNRKRDGLALHSIEFAMSVELTPAGSKVRTSARPPA